MLAADSLASEFSRLSGNCKAPLLGSRGSLTAGAPLLGRGREGAVILGATCRPSWTGPRAVLRLKAGSGHDCPLHRLCRILGISTLRNQVGRAFSLPAPFSASC